MEESQVEKRPVQRKATPLINPLGFVTIERANLAKRLNTLKGKTIGIYDNGKPRADVIMAEVKHYLESKGAVCSIYEFKKRVDYPLPQEQLERLAKADAVVGALGD
jgi:hypothetical protein